MAKTVKKLKVVKELKLDLGCGPHPKEGFTGVDIADFGQPIKADLNKKWQWKDNSVDEVFSSHTLEHFSGEERVHFMNELYRVLKPGAKAQFVVPHWASARAYGDPTHKWPPVGEMTWLYLNRDWRALNAPHVGYRCDFDFTYGYALAPGWETRSQEAQQFGLMHYREVAMDMMATLTKRVE